MAELTPSPPSVTAIIIFLNEAKYLDQAIRSVLDQTYTDWELILVDDGSTDVSTHIARNYAERYPGKVIALEHPGHANLGMSASRNLGLSRARGQSIGFLDGDDVWLPEKLEQQTRMLNAHPDAAMVFGPLIEWHAWSSAGGEDRLYCVAANGKHPFENQLVQPPNMLELFLRDECFIPSGVLFRHDAYKQVGGFEDTFRGSFEDAVFHVKMCSRFPVYVHAQAYYKYRIHTESCERQIKSSRDRLERERRFIEWTRAYLDEQGIDDPAVIKACNKWLTRCRHPTRTLVLSWFASLPLRLEQVVIRVGRRVLPSPLRAWLWSKRNALRG